VRVKSIIETLKAEYLDLLLIHWPGPIDIDFGGSPEAVGKKCSMEYFRANIAEAWANMLRLKTDGLVKQIGCSNFYAAHIKALKEAQRTDAVVMPYANQIYIDAAHQEQDFVAALQKMGVRVMAYRPVAFLGMYSMLKQMGISIGDDLEALVKLSKAQSAHQLVLAVLMRRSIHVLCKSSNEGRQKANLAAAKLAPSLSEEVLTGFAKLGDHAMMVDMVGACDEYAKAFRQE